MLEICIWIENGDGVYETSCKNMFEFFEDGPRENVFHFCQYCGKNIEANA